MCWEIWDFKVSGVCTVAGFESFPGFALRVFGFGASGDWWASGLNFRGLGLGVHGFGKFWLLVFDSLRKPAVHYDDGRLEWRR